MRLAAYHPARNAPPRAQAATWAWAGNSSPLLGLIQPGESWPFISIGRPCVTSAGSKPHPPVTPPQTLAHFCLPFSPSALLTPPASCCKGARRTGARKRAFGGRGWRRREALRRRTRAAARGPVEWPCDRRPFGSSSRAREHKTAEAQLPDLDRRRARIGDRQRRRASFSPRDGFCDGDERTRVSKKPNKQQHLWIRKETSGSGKKALRLIDAVSKLPNEREAIYGALDKWSAFEPEFPIIAAAKALGMLKRRRQWLRIIQVTKWLMSKGQVLTWTTYDTLLLALFMDKRVDEAELIWNTVIQTHTRSVPKRLFSRMILMYDICQRPDKVLEIYADMEELGVRPDEDTARRIGKAFVAFGQEEKEKHVLEKYWKKWKYIHFNGERVRVLRDGPLA